MFLWSQGQFTAYEENNRLFIMSEQEYEGYPATATVMQSMRVALQYHMSKSFFVLQYMRLQKVQFRTQILLETRAMILLNYLVVIFHQKSLTRKRYIKPNILLTPVLMVKMTNQLYALCRLQLRMIRLFMTLEWMKVGVRWYSQLQILNL